MAFSFCNEIPLSNAPSATADLPPYDLPLLICHYLF